MYYTMFYLLRLISSSPRRRKKKIRRKLVYEENNAFLPGGVNSENYIIPALAAFAVYVNGLRGDFVHDDVPAVLRNPDVNGKNVFLSRVFKNDFWGSEMTNPLSHKSYRPLTILVFRFCFWFGEGSPLPFHCVNVALHISSTLFLSLICLNILKLNSKTTLLVSTLFAVHPIHTETVSGIVGCADLLSANFLLFSFISYTRSSSFLFPDEPEKKFWHITSLICAISSLLSKETGISALAINVAFTFFLESKSKTKKRIPSGLFSFMLLLVSRLAIQKQSLPEFSESDNPAAFHPDPMTRFYTFLYLPVHNFWMLLCPCTLSYDWQMGSIPLIESAFDIRNFGSLSFYAGLWKIITIGGTTFQETVSKNVMNRSVVAAFLFLILPFLPATNLFFPVGFVIAERILYLPSIGFCILVGLGYERMNSVRHRKFHHRRFFGLILGLLLLSYVCKTVRRNWDWTSRESLFESGLINTPSNAKVHYNFANMKRESGDVYSAIAHYKEALRLWPNYVPAHNNLATILNDQSKVEYHLRKALEANPGHPNSLYNLASLLRSRGMYEEAIPLLERCIEVNQFDQAAYTLLFDCLRETKRIDSDGEDRNSSFVVGYEVSNEPVKLRQDLVPKDAHHSVSFENNLNFLSQMAEIYISLSKYEKASRALHKILEINPYHMLSLYQLSQVYLEQNMKEEALKTIDFADDLCRSLSPPCFGHYCERLCRRILIQKGDIYRNNQAYEDAIKLYTKALEKTPLEPSLLLSIGALHHALGEWDLAWKRYYECLKVDPENKDLLSNMERLIRAQKASSNTGKNSTFN